MLREDAENHRNYNGKNWASQIKDMLQQHGLGYVWQKQFEIEIPFLTIKQRISDNYLKNGTLKLIIHHVCKVTVFLNTLLKLKVSLIFSLIRNTE